MNPLRRIHGLDHKCYRCGSILGEHIAPDFFCPTSVGVRYESKGPQPSFEFRALLEELEASAAEILERDVFDQGTEQSFEHAKDRYKSARFRLFKYVQELERK